jgi:hypothetical protein
MIQFTRITIALALAATLTGCGNSEEYTPKAGMTAVQIFEEACEWCQGTNGGGKFGFLFKVAGAEASAAHIAQRIAEGGVIMPAFPRIPEPERLALGEFLKAQE